jgi:hypothetical protein
MDIEGNEWKILESLGENDLNRFKIIVIELHQLHEICFRSLYQERFRALYNLTKNHVPIVVSKNPTAVVSTYCGVSYPDVVEVTLVHRDAINLYK